jgi:hypothetical protein
MLQQLINYNIAYLRCVCQSVTCYIAGFGWLCAVRTRSIYCCGALHGKRKKLIGVSRDMAALQTTSHEEEDEIDCVQLPLTPMGLKMQ